jgi:hypothetical protein
LIIVVSATAVEKDKDNSKSENDHRANPGEHVVSLLAGEKEEHFRRQTASHSTYYM